MYGVVGLLCSCVVGVQTLRMATGAGRGREVNDQEMKIKSMAAEVVRENQRRQQKGESKKGDT